MVLFKLKQLMQFIEAIQSANSFHLLLALDQIDKPSTLDDLNKKMAMETGVVLTSGQLRHSTDRLLTLNMVSVSKIKRGRKTIHIYNLTQNGNRLVNAIKKFLEALE